MCDLRIDSEMELILDCACSREVRNGDVRGNADCVMRFATADIKKAWPKSKCFRKGSKDPSHTFIDYRQSGLTKWIDEFKTFHLFEVAASVSHARAAVIAAGPGGKENDLHDDY